MFVAAVLAAAPTAAQQRVLEHAHAHNDYVHERPLLDALHHGFTSVEADVHLVDGELLVAHDRSQTRPGRTLQRLYLDPLRSWIRAHDGEVHPNGPGLTLLVDVKSEAEPTYRRLREILRGYAGMLTVFGGGEIDRGPVTVVISGNRARALVAEQPVRYAAIDGRPPDLEGASPPPADLVPLVSAPWSYVTEWRGTGAMPEEDRRRLRALVETAHAQGRRVRFWATGDRPAVWRAELDAGVDLLNADDLGMLKEFLLEQR